MAKLSVLANPDQVKDLADTLEGVANGVSRAEAAAINRTVTHIRAVSARKVREHLNLPVSRIKEAITAPQKATAANPSATIRYSHKPVPLMDYKARDVRPNGVTVTERLDKGRQTYRHYFIATMPNGHQGVFRRAPGAKSWRIGGRWTALPIREVFGASVQGTFARAPGILGETIADAGPFLAQQLASQVNRLLHRQKPADDVDSEP
jgi:hypothetical protein